MSKITSSYPADWRTRASSNPWWVAAHGTRRAATVKCAAAAVVWALDRNTFRITMAKEIEREGRETAEWLSQVGLEVGGWG